MAPIGDQQYDVSPKEAELIRKRAAMKEALKRDYQKQVSNPYRHALGEGGHVFDPQIQRFMSMRVTRYQYFKPGFKSFAQWVGLMVLPTLALTYYMYHKREEFEGKCRRGEISARDRRFRFN